MALSLILIYLAWFATKTTIKSPPPQKKNATFAYHFMLRYS